VKRTTPKCVGRASWARARATGEVKRSRGASFMARLGMWVGTVGTVKLRRVLYPQGSTAELGDNGLVQMALPVKLSRKQPRTGICDIAVAIQASDP
jgi:hypothetical protein